MKGKRNSPKTEKRTRKHASTKGRQTAAVNTSAPRNHLLEHDVIQEGLDVTEETLLEQEMDMLELVEKQSPFPLLALPAELRNKIYELVIVSSKPISIRWNTMASRYEGPEQPALSKISKQLRTETLPMFYGVNIIELGPSPRIQPNYWDDVRTWLTRTGPVNCSLMKRFVLVVAVEMNNHEPSLTHEDKRYAIWMRRKLVEIGTEELLAEAGIEFSVKIYWQTRQGPDLDEACQSALAAEFEGLGAEAQELLYRESLQLVEDYRKTIRIHHHARPAARRKYGGKAQH